MLQLTTAEFLDSARARCVQTAVCRVESRDTRVQCAELPERTQKPYISWRKAEAKRYNLLGFSAERRYYLLGFRVTYIQQLATHIWCVEIHVHTQRCEKENQPAKARRRVLAACMAVSSCLPSTRKRHTQREGGRNVRESMHRKALKEEHGWRSAALTRRWRHTARGNLGVLSHVIAAATLVFTSPGTTARTSPINATST